MAQNVQVFVEAGLLVDDSVDPHTHEYGGEALNMHSEWDPIIKAAMIVGYHPNLAVIQNGRKGKSQGSTRFLRTASQPATVLHPSSLNNRKARDEKYEMGAMFMFADLAKSSKFHLMFVRLDTQSLVDAIRDHRDGDLVLYASWDDYI